MTTPVIKIEIIVESSAIQHLVERLERAGFGRYTLIQDVLGQGDRGERGGGPVALLSNSYLLICCPPADREKIIELVRPVLKRAGGVCLLSDAEAVVH